MSLSAAPGFAPKELQPRYDKPFLNEDEWHVFGDRKKDCVLSRNLARPRGSHWLLNAGCGVHERGAPGWTDLSVDLFIEPIRRHRLPVCASVEQLPFASSTIGAVVCVGEVLGYCDPARTLTEFARVLEPGGLLICDFGSTRSYRYVLSNVNGRAAQMVSVQYNSSPERIWIYDPDYIISLLDSVGFSIREVEGIYQWSALAQRCGVSARTSLQLERLMSWWPLPHRRADLIVVVAGRC
jgi:SAM-dependent methyltransferase